MRIYLDNCCFNRPFDNQAFMRIRLETDAKLYIQEKIKKNELALVWSYILEFENSMNPYKDKRDRILKWKALAAKTVYETPEILSAAKGFGKCGIKNEDALHLACATTAACDCFITTDDKILNKKLTVPSPHIINPVEFVTAVISGGES